MDVRMAVIADHASVDKADKLSVNGIFGVIWAEETPAIHPVLNLVFQLEFNTLEAREKDIHIVLRDADARELLSLSGVMQVPLRPEGEPILVSQIIHLSMLTFPQFGRYEFKIIIDDDPEITIPLTVARPVRK
jgi:hypothetical protein